MELQVSPAGDKVLTGEIHRQLHRPRTTAAGGRPQGRP
jgi:hypothetical protein